MSVTEMFTTLDRKEILDVLLDTEIFTEPRIPSGPYDWGDQATVGKHLKHHGVNFMDAKWSQYGRYLGKHPIGYVVAIKAGPEAGPEFIDMLAGGEVFATLDDMKSRWMLD